MSLFIIFFSPAKYFFADLSVPFLKTGSSFYESFSFVSKWFSGKDALVEENLNLSKKIESLNADLISYESLMQENQNLRQELGLKPKGSMVSAEIIARSPQMPIDSILINKGVSDGVKNGDFVLVSSSVFIGKISKAASLSSVVTLNSFPGTNIYGQVERTGESIEINGTGGGNMQIKVPIDFDIVPGDRVDVSMTGSNVAAIAGAIDEDKSSGFKTVIFSLPANLSKLKTVFIEKSAQ